MKHRRGFTLIELIVAVILVGVLMAVVVPRILSSTDDANTKLIAKSVRDIREAVVMAKIKCLNRLNTAGEEGHDTGQLLQALAHTDCQILPQNLYSVDEENWAKVKDFKIRTDFRNANNVIRVEIDCNGNNSICGKVRIQLNEIYGGGACQNPPANGILTCTLSL